MEGLEEGKEEGERKVVLQEETEIPVAQLHSIQVVELKDGIEMEEEQSMVANTATLRPAYEEAQRRKEERRINKAVKAVID